MEYVTGDLGAQCLSLVKELEHVTLDEDALEKLVRILQGEGLVTPKWDHPALPAGAGDDLNTVVWLGNALNFCYWVPHGERMWGYEVAGKREVDAFALFGMLTAALVDGIDLRDGNILKSDVPRLLFNRGDGHLPLLERRAAILAEMGEVLLESFDSNTPRL